jgi:hypothetical protein
MVQDISSKLGAWMDNGLPSLQQQPEMFLFLQAMIGVDRCLPV